MSGAASCAGDRPHRAELRPAAPRGIRQGRDVRGAAPRVGQARGRAAPGTQWLCPALHVRGCFGDGFGDVSPSPFVTCHPSQAFTVYASLEGKTAMSMVDFLDLAQARAPPAPCQKERGPCLLCAPRITLIRLSLLFNVHAGTAGRRAAAGWGAHAPAPHGHLRVRAGGGAAPPASARSPPTRQRAMHYSVRRCSLPPRPLSPAPAA